MLSFSSRIVIITGHYGTGKTNFSLNLALDYTSVFDHVTLVDLDVVNPYFRSSDYSEFLKSAGVQVISPVLAGTNLDTPSLSSAIYGAIENAQRSQNDFLIIDVGGDDVGATALGRFCTILKSNKYEMVYVINKYRNMTQHPQDSIKILKEIEAKSGLKTTGLIANSHLQDQTTVQTIKDSFEFNAECQRLSNLPILAICIPENNSVEFATLKNIYPVKQLVKTPWQYI